VRKADNLSPSCAVVTKSGSLNFLEPSGPVQACNGTALPLPVTVDGFNETLNFLDRLKKKAQIANFIKKRPVEAELFPADRHDETNSHFPQFCALACKSDVML